MTSAGVPLTVFPSRVSPPTIAAASTVQMTAVATTSSTTVPASMSSSVPSTAGGKDSRWLTLEVCREHVRRRCARSDDECRFAHPPPHVEVQNGRVVCCFDSIKGRCQRTDPPCKYLHPPQHLKEQLLQNGRHNLIMRNLHLQRLQPLQPTAIYSFVSPYLVQTSPPPACYAPYFGSTSPCVAQSTMSTAGPGASNGIIANMMPTAAAASTTTMTPSCSQLENDCAVDETVPSSGGDPYWTVAPPIFAVDNTTSPAASYYSPVFFQSVGAAPPSGLMLKPQQTMVGGDGKNGYAIYSCGSSAYPQLALPMPQGPCYPMTITAAPPVVAGSFPRY